MTAVAVAVSLLIAVAAGWWVAQTPGRPQTRADVPAWAQASASRSLVAVLVCAATASACGNAAPRAGVWVWLGAIVAALAVIAFTAAGWATDPSKRVPTMVFPIGWALLALAVGIWVASNTNPVLSNDTVDMTHPFVVGQRAAFLVIIVGAAHTWWMWKSRAARRKSQQARHDDQVLAMRAQIEREQQRSSKQTMRGKRRR